MIILNFSHALTEEQKERIKVIENISDQHWLKSKVIRVNCYIDIDESLPDQIRGILSRIPSYVWDKQLLIVPPPIAHSAILVLISIFSKCGYFPPVIRIKKRRGSRPPEYVVAEIIDLDAFKSEARSRRQTQKIITHNIGE